MDCYVQVDDLFVAYAIGRAARSVREAEEAQQFSQLRTNAQLGQDDLKTDRHADGPVPGRT